MSRNPCDHGDPTKPNIGRNYAVPIAWLPIDHRITPGHGGTKRQNNSLAPKAEMARDSETATCLANK
jgi:hypothetical protein